MTFCTDIDLLHWEPNIFRDAAFASQTLLTGTGASVAGGVLTIASGSFIDSKIPADSVVVLTGSVAGSFPIISIDSASTCTISVMYEDLYPEDGVPAPAPVGTASGLTIAIRTFGPQRSIVSELLKQSAGIEPTSDPFNAPQIVNPKAMKRACVLGSLQMIYNALAAATGAPDEYAVRSDLYQQLYRRAVRSTNVEIDLNNDGVADERRKLNVLQLSRR
jgi:hypothetical protein